MPFDFGERLGLFLIVEAALYVDASHSAYLLTRSSLSTIAVTTLLLFVGYRLYKKYQSRRLDKKRKLAAIQQDASSSYYFISLMVGELIQALGTWLFKWFRAVLNSTRWCAKHPMDYRRGVLLLLHVPPLPYSPF